MFTKGHDRELLDKTEKSRRFTADEHSWIIRQEFSKTFSSKEAVVRYFLSKNESKLVTLAYLIRFVYRHHAKKILSLGAGMCVIEEFLRQALPEDGVVIATDFNDFLIGNAQQFFPGLVAVKFDFFRDDIRAICDAVGSPVDLAVFMGSSYVMDDDEFIRILAQLKDNQVKRVIDVTPTLVPYHNLPLLILGELKCSLTRQDRGKFHGFQRTRLDFRNIYRKAGWTLKEETSAGDYNYVAILENV
jgi:hypothetical protein